MKIGSPDHLTPFGVWLWWRLPRWTRVSTTTGQGCAGLVAPSGFIWMALMADYYHGFWPQLGITYWRRSVWLMGWPMLKWRRWHRQYCNQVQRKAILTLCGVQG